MEMSEIKETKDKRRSMLLSLLIRLVKEKPLGTFGAVIVLIMLITGIFANQLAPYGMNEVVLKDRLQAPSAAHPFGTDQLGRDLLSRVIYGARISMYVGLGASLINIVCGIIIGTITGFIGGKLDLVVQRFVDAWMCFPGLIIFMTVLSITGPGLIQVILVLGISSGIKGSRVMRGAVIGIKENMYFDVAKAIGASTTRVLIRHILPNIMAVAIIVFTMAMGTMIISEASLSFLGFGVPPPEPSWGGMLSGSGRRYMARAPWMAIFPGLALAIVVFGINMLGDAVRDLLDPRLKGGAGRYSGAKIKGRAKKAREAAAVEKTV
jgi:peptide/nickel transport system permease protein